MLQSIPSQLIYASPSRRPKVRKIIHEKLYIYIYKYNVQYGNGMIVCAAKDYENAVSILEKRMSPNQVIFDNINKLEGAIYTGAEGILSEQSYHE